MAYFKIQIMKKKRKKAGPPRIIEPGKTGADLLKEKGYMVTTIKGKLVIEIKT